MEEIEGLEKIEPKLMDKFRENPWMLSTIVLGVITLVLLITSFNFGMTGNVIAEDVAGEKLVGFLNTQADGIVTLEDISEESGLYKVNVEYQGEVIPLYTTKDGKFFIQGVVPLTGDAVQQPTDPQSASAEIPKSDKPKIELFIMTHCPYGTQAEKGFIPFIESFGNKVDAKIRFVHYFMHEPEETETPRQVCIREEQPTRYLAYLRKFLEEGDSDVALITAGIDVAKMNSCIDSGKWEAYYNEDSALSQGYGVQGSPTLIINGQIASSGRSASAYLSTACSAFNTVPDECSTLSLSSSNPAPMWGWDEASSATSAQC